MSAAFGLHRYYGLAARLVVWPCGGRLAPWLSNASHPPHPSQFHKFITGRDFVSNARHRPTNIPVYYLLAGTAHLQK
jgi:hypothetical protein